MAEESFRVSVPLSFSASELDRFGNLVVDYVIRRSKQGLGVNRSTLGTYSESYKESADFETAGKSGSKVNLTLTGDMLDSLDVLRTSPGFITVGYEDGSDENDKARYMREKGYNFLGISDDEKNRLLKRFRSQDQTVSTIVPTVAQSFLRRILGGN